MSYNYTCDEDGILHCVVCGKTVNECTCDHSDDEEDNEDDWDGDDDEQEDEE